ncbi:AgmX/PglI C-terminal domain-containing protein [Fibrobacter sp. UWB11]|uniref:AgmX/PglI C-terminal domain-containing protein n=1 Tax=Fibrobacter sp. UWB11 TaxID=1896202 RepID=UPI0009270040|nr:AgmX/PglI C-terminal domain-containing protein [Fibrobacter sp. UWB11]SIO02805.1 TonB family C-terminal domain-containing protein [Fibrobacter sp. UWB11]
MKTTNKKQDAFIASLMPDSDKKMVRIASASLIVALALGFWATTYERIIDDVIFDTTPRVDMDVSVKLNPIKEEKKQEPKPKTQTNRRSKDDSNKKMGKKEDAGGGKPKGPGDPKAALNRGVLKELAIRTNKAGLQAYDLMNQKFASDVNKVLTHVNVLMKSGTTRIGNRRGTVNTEFNPGIAAGGSGGIKDGLGGLFSGSGTRFAPSGLKGNITTPKPNQIDMGAGGGSRSASDIMKVVRQRTPGLRHIYNKHLKKKPGFQGKVTLKFTIAPGGEIISMAVVGSTTGYPEFDNEVKKAVSGWTFGKVKSGNTTVTIPFTFTE